MPKTYDLIIRDVEMFDGMGSDPTHCDVGVEQDRISVIGTLENVTATTEISGAGKSLSPGFIDVHTHDDFAALAQPDMGFKSKGGVTTCIVGNCGYGAAPFAAAKTMLGKLTPEFDIEPYEGHAGYADAVEESRPGVNIGVLAGHGTFRLAAVGNDDRPPSDKEMTVMKSYMAEALDAGVLGLSSGLIYEPGKYARTDELIELCGTMEGSGALYATHIRNEGSGLLDAVGEAITIGAKARVPVQISHHKAMGRENWGLVDHSLELIVASQGRGESVHADQYPYTAGSTSLRAIIDNGAFTSSESSGGFGLLGAQDVIVASCHRHPEYEGKSIAELSAEMSLSPRDTAIAVADSSPGTTAILHVMSEDDVQTVLRHHSTMIGSDGLPTLSGKPHPRLYNTFARVLGHYARDLGLMDMSTAIHRMCGFPAKKFGLTHRGVIEEGAFADLVLFDSKTLLDKGTIENPNHFPSGIDRVIVNGVTTVQNGQLVGSRAGRLLKRQT
jgi:N-acyl-D-amino-acid deacylase